MERSLDDKQKDMVINFGAFDYSASKMASILMWEEQDVLTLIQNQSSEFYKLYKKGQEMADYVIDLKLFEMAQSGDLKALQKFEFRKKQKRDGT